MRGNAYNDSLNDKGSYLLVTYTFICIFNDADLILNKLINL